MRRIAFIPVVFILSVALSCSKAPESDSGAIQPAEPQRPAAAGATEPDKSPEEVAEAFFETANAGDTEGFATLLTNDSRSFIEGDSGFSLSEEKFESYSIGEATVGGSTAEVPATAMQAGKEQDLTLKMRQEDNAWRVHAIKVTAAEGVSMEIDFEKMGSMMEAVVESMGNALKEGFEQAVQDMQQGGSAQEIAEKKVRFEHLEATTEEALKERWLVDEDDGNGTALEALQKIAAPLGLTIFAGEHADALAGAVNVDVAGQSRLEAIEAIANEAGLYPIYPAPLEIQGFAGAMVDALADGMTTMLGSDESAIAIEGMDETGSTDKDSPSNEEAPANAITFEEGPRPYPAIFQGPFLITVEEVDENVPHATGEVFVTALAYGLDPGLLMLLGDYGETAVFDRVENADGESLKANEDVRYYGGGQIAGTAYRDRTGIDLKGLVRNVETISVISGVQRLILPESVATVEFSTLREGASQTAGDLRVNVRRTGKNTEFEVRGPSERLDDLMVKFWAEDGNGEDLGIMFQTSANWTKDKVQASLQTPEPPATVRMKLINPKVLEYEFELRDIPLEHHAEMPEKIEGLDFGDHQKPVEVEFVKFTDRDNPDFPKVLVRTRNNSNKDALTIHARFTYLDRQGKELKDFPHTLQGAFSASGHAPAVEEGGTAEIETTAFFMPEETTTLEVSVEKVEFIDGTQWEQ